MILVDLDSQALSTNNVPILGLYAAGELMVLSFNVYPPYEKLFEIIPFDGLT